ncbi:MAG: flavodoxin domain-containing protein [Mariniphaga sp.]
MSGYIAGFSAQQTELPVADQETASSVSQMALTILYGSRTGNGEGLAKKAQRLAEIQGRTITLKNMESYRPRDLQAEKNLLVVVSTPVSKK